MKRIFFNEVVTRDGFQIRARVHRHRREGPSSQLHPVLPAVTELLAAP